MGGHACFCWNNFEIHKSMNNLPKISDNLHGAIKNMYGDLMKCLDPLPRDSLLLITKSPGDPSIHFIYLKMMQG